MKKTDLEKFSWYKGVSQTTPLMETDLDYVYTRIRSFREKEKTEKIRAGKADKTKVLPAVTFSGLFSKRGESHLKTYSSLICMDIDKLDFAQTLKERLAKDTFLNPVLIFISPRGHGLKIVVRVKYGISDNHKRYFAAIALYLNSIYGISADDSGSDVSRLCFICHDPEPFYFEDGYVTSEDLLKLNPRVDVRPCVSAPDRVPNPVRVTPASAYVEAIREEKNKFNPVTGRSEPPSILLNQMDAVHSLAVDALIRHGWQQKTDILWTRPGKPLKEGHSAKYNVYGSSGIYFLTNFSSEAPHFIRKKAYTDVGIICELDYNSDFKKCISELAIRFLDRIN